MSIQPAHHDSIRIAADYESLSRLAAECILPQVRSNPDALLCVPTGATPTRTYELLAEYADKEPRLFERTRWLQLDEWLGLPADNPHSCRAYLQDKLLRPLRIEPAQFMGWDGRAADPGAECRRISEWLKAHGPIDLAILGLGLNGHVGFNEPMGALPADAHVAELTESTRHHPMLGEFRGQVRGGMTLGLSDILHAHRVLLLVSGASKAGPLRTLLSRQLSLGFPASLLWLHPQLTILRDRAAMDDPR
jgi:galactosamine-6-phosphate isomerase